MKYGRIFLSPTLTGLTTRLAMLNIASICKRYWFRCSANCLLNKFLESHLCHPIPIILTIDQNPFSEVAIWGGWTWQAALSPFTTGATWYFIVHREIQKQSQEGGTLRSRTGLGVSWDISRRGRILAIAIALHPSGKQLHFIAAETNEPLFCAEFPISFEGSIWFLDIMIYERYLNIPYVMIFERYLNIPY